MAEISQEKVVPVVVPIAEPVDTTSSSNSIWSSLTSNAIVASASSAIAAFQEKRAALGLPNPGTVESISQEVDRDVFLNYQMFTGLRAEISKPFSVAPMFQVSHQFSMGSQAQPPYTFATIYGSPRVFMQANLDNDFQFQGRFHWRWTNALISKTSAQLAPGGTQAAFSIENDYKGSDFSASIKAINPSMLEGGFTGVVTGDYLQSVTSKLSLGVSTLWQRSAMNQGPEMLLSYAARYKAKDWIATARLAGGGSLQTTYWRKIAEKVEAGVDLNLQVAQSYGPGGRPVWKKDGLATVGARYDFRAASFRAQVDSQGRVAALLEKRVAPPVQLTFIGEIDHVKNQAKVGLSVSIESSSEELMEQQESAVGIPPPPF